MQRLYRVVVDVPPEQPLTPRIWRQYRQKLKFVHAAVVIGLHSGKLKQFADRVFLELGTRPFHFVEMSDRAQLCCDVPVLKASCLLARRRNHLPADLHILDRAISSTGTECRWHESWFARCLALGCSDEIDQPQVQWCAHSCSSSAPHQLAHWAPEWLVRLLGELPVQRELPLRPWASNPSETDTKTEATHWSSARLFPSDSFHDNRKKGHTNLNRFPEHWAVMQAVTCCDNEGMSVHSELASF